MESLTIIGKDPFDIVQALVSIVGFPLTIYSIVIGNRNTQRSIDVQVITALAIEFHRKWDADWRGLIATLRVDGHLTADNKAKVYSLLNWIDWLGVLIHRGAFRNTPLVMDTIGSSLLEAITVSRDILNEQGRDEWVGVFEVARRLGIVSQAGAIFATTAAQERLMKNYATHP